MRIDSLQLVNYVRIELNNIRDFTITPNEIYQFILGTNGSGKSSILREMTPEPGNPDDFHKGGFKLIKITHNNKKYVLKNTFGQKNHHSFIEIVGDIETELNPGGTVTIQRELNKKIFKIDAEIIKLIMGDEKFHLMSPARRREWFTKLSPTDYSYAFGLYNHFREAVRDYTGTLRNLKKQLVEAVSNVLSEQDLQQLKDEVDLTVKELNILLRESTSNGKDLRVLETSQKDMLNTLNTLYKKLTRLRLMAPYGTTVYGVGFDTPIVRDDFGNRVLPAITSMVELDMVLSNIKTRLNELTANIELRYKDLEHENKKYELAKKTDNVGAKQLEEKITLLFNEIESNKGKIKLNLQYTDNSAALVTFLNYESFFNELSQTLPSNIDGKYSSDNLRIKEELVFKLTSDKLVLENKLASLNNQLNNSKNLLDKNSVTCPNCNHSWHLDSIENNIAILEKNIIEYSTIHEEKSKQLKAEESQLDELRAYAALYREYIKVTRNAPILIQFWNKVNDERILQESPAIISNLVTKAIEDLTLLKTIDVLRLEVDKNKDLLLAVNELGDEQILDIKGKVDSIRDDIDRLTHDKYLNTNIYSQYENYRNQLSEAFRLNDEILATSKTIESLQVDKVEALRQKTIEHCITQLQTSLATKQTYLDSALTLKKKVEQLEESIMTYSKQEEYGKIILKEMSPTDGLIARGLLSFVRNYTKRMNSLIRKVWSYPLYINDCGVISDESVELDYYFPLTVQNKKVNDVKFGSTAMQEMIDLAFVNEAMKSLGISDFPLYLDEFGSGFDEAHRGNAANTIKSIMETQQHSQLFMISHYSSVYGAFTNAEFCVLDNRNIAVPSVNNKHVTIINKN